MQNQQPGPGPFYGQPGQPVYQQVPPAPVFTSSQIRAMARAKLKGKWKMLFAPVIIYIIMSMLPGMIYSVSYLSDLQSAGLLSGDSSAYIDTLQSAMGFSDGSDAAVFSPLTSMLSNFVSFYQLILTGVFGIAIATIALKTIRDESVSPADALTGFNRFGQSFCAGIMVMFFTFLWRCLFILPGSFMLGFGMAASAISAGGAYMLLLLAFAATLAGAIGGVIFTMRYEMTYFIASDDRSMRASEAVARSVFMMKKKVGSLFVLVLSFIGWIILAAIPLSVAMAALMFSTSFAGKLIAVMLMAVFMAAYAPLALYIETAKAIYYSTLTGNFRAGNAPSEAAAESVYYGSALNNTDGHTNVSSDSTSAPADIPDEDHKDPGQ